MASDPEIFIGEPKNIPKECTPELIDLIASSAQVHKRFIQQGIPKAMLIGIMREKEIIATTATIKSPLESYRAGVFKKAAVSELTTIYPVELGYIVTDKNFEGKKLCRKLLNQLMSAVMGYNIFATTRKPEMIHILKKFSFNPIGNAYDDGLRLLIRDSQSLIKSMS